MPGWLPYLICWGVFATDPFIGSKSSTFSDEIRRMQRLHAANDPEFAPVETYGAALNHQDSSSSVPMCNRVFCDCRR